MHSEISRVTRTREEARAAYDRISKWYDLFAGPGEKRLRDAGLRIPNVGAGKAVLEIGVGTGQALLPLAQSVGELGKVYGVDLSPRMLEIARARVDRMELSGQVELVCADAVRLPLRAGAFDAIFVSFVQ